MQLRRALSLFGLNPSTQDGINSKTVKKLVNILENNGYGSLCLLNLFSYRNSNPSALRKVEDNLTDEDNDKAIKKVFAIHDADVALMWGTIAKSIDQERIDWLLDNIPVDRNIKCFGITKQGDPQHPLMMSNKTKLIEYEIK